MENWGGLAGKKKSCTLFFSLQWDRQKREASYGPADSPMLFLGLKQLLDLLDSNKIFICLKENGLPVVCIIKILPRLRWVQTQMEGNKVLFLADKALTLMEYLIFTDGTH